MNALKISGVGLAVIFGVLIFAAVYVPDIRPALLRVGVASAPLTPTGVTFELGGINLNLADAQGRITTLLNPTLNLGNGRYDSLDSPLGTDFIVPAGFEFHVTDGDMPHDPPESVISFGWGDTHVENSIAAPTNSVIAFRITLDDGSPHEFTMHVIVPAGKYPFVRFEEGTGSLDGPGWFLGVSLDLPE